jgi:hypothetical protein
MAAVIPVARKPEPPTFDGLVRKPGNDWIKRQGLDPDKPAPPRTKIAPYWRACLADLYLSYEGTCAYLAIHFELTTGAGSVDHFAAKSKAKLSEAYEWGNYRLACLSRNTLKREFADLLDPFEIKEGMFHLEVVSGRIYANPALTKAERGRVEKTIRRLGLDGPNCREMRARHYEEYRRGECTADHMRKRSPFVWYEAERQGLL